MYQDVGCTSDKNKETLSIKTWTLKSEKTNNNNNTGIEAFQAFF